MIERRFQPRYSSIAFVAAMLLPAGVVFAQGGDQQLDQISADWAKRQNRIRRVKYEVGGEVLMPRENITDDAGVPIKSVGESAIKAPFQWTCLFDFHKNRHRLQIIEHKFFVPENRLVRYEYVQTFDGKNSWGSGVREVDRVRKPDDVDLYVHSGEFRKFYLEATLFPLFYGHGIVPYAGSERVFPGHLTFEPLTELLTMHGQVVHDGRPCLALRTPPTEGNATFFDELWVDLSRDSAVVRHARYAHKTPIIDTFVWYRQTSHGWLPDRWEMTMRGSQQRVIEVKRNRVDHIDIDPEVTDGDFRLEEKPGMLVKTGVHPPWRDDAEMPPAPTEVRRYRIDEDGRRREVSFEDGVERRVGSRSRWLWGVAGVVLFAALLTAVYLSRRGRRQYVTGVAGSD